MRMTYSTMYAKFLRNINAVGSTDTNIQAEFNSQLGAYYQLMLAKLKNYRTTQPYTFTTVTDALASATPTNQYYAYPPGEISIDGIYITIGSVNYPLKIIDSEYIWEQLNAITIQSSALPAYYYPRRDDFGIWPIPQAAYSGVMMYRLRDRNLTVSDYTSGTISVTAGSATVTGSSTTFTPAMVGRWFTITDTTVAGQGYWYRIASYTSATSITLSRTYTGSTASGAAYLIGESPEIPEEGHMTLVDGITGGFYTDYRKDPSNGAAFLNKFWTGDMTNTSRNEGDTQIGGGLISLINRYADRDDTRVIDRKPKVNPLNWKPWSTTLSS